MIEVTNMIEKLLQRDLITIVVGDFNFDASEKNDLTELLASKKYKQLMKQPTHDQGRIIDQCYVP